MSRISSQAPSTHQMNDPPPRKSVEGEVLEERDTEKATMTREQLQCLQSMPEWLSIFVRISWERTEDKVRPDHNTPISVSQVILKGASSCPNQRVTDDSYETP